MGTSQYNIRRATVSDLDWLIPQLKDFSQFFGSSIPLFPSEDFARTALAQMITDHLVLIAEHKTSGPVGFISGYLFPHAFNPQINVLTETFWWVQEDYRSSRAGLMLLEEFTKFGRAHADWITFTLEHHSPVRDETLLKRGYRFSEKSFLMEVV